MTFYEYQQKVVNTIKYPKDMGPYQSILGLIGNSGTIAKTLNKILYTQNGQVKESDLFQLKNDLGDVMWYIAAVSNDLGLSLDEIVLNNVNRIST